jgi:hypothetical protein
MDATPVGPRLAIASNAALTWAECAGLFPVLAARYGRIMVPAGPWAVLAGGTSPRLGALAGRLVAAPRPAAPPPVEGDGGLMAEDLEVLLLAREHPGSIAIVEDRRARNAGTQMGVAVTGALGLVLMARREGMISSATVVLKKLRAAGYPMARKTLLPILLLAGEESRLAELVG